jgi:hypothetical protein
LSSPRILCLVPALPSEVRLDTLQSIFNQTIPVVSTILLTEKIMEKMPFPAKISKVINNMLNDLKLENYDYLLRVDADTVLPPNFIEGNLKHNFDVIGYGPAQLIKMSSFQKYMGGRMHPDHDDGYPLVKFAQCGLKSKDTYFIAPNIQRVGGLHHGSSWFISQGELHFRYGYDIFTEIGIVFGKYRKYHPYGVFFLVGFFKALFQRKKRFDVAASILAGHFLKYSHPSRFLKFRFYMRKKIMQRGLFR